MKTLSEIKATLQNLLPDLQKRYSIIYLGIFGSYVRGEQTAESDVDILIEFSPNLRLGLLTFCEIENYLSDQLEIKVDLVEKTALKPQIGQQILQEVLSLWPQNADSVSVRAKLGALNVNEQDITDAVEWARQL